jgi:bacterioferritin
MGILCDMEGLRQRAQKHVEAGAVTDEYNADRAEVVETFNILLATELMCVLRYKRHYYTAKGISAEAVKKWNFLSMPKKRSSMPTVLPSGSWN